jgi:hypothetical protein
MIDEEENAGPTPAEKTILSDVSPSPVELTRCRTDIHAQWRLGGAARQLLGATNG